MEKTFSESYKENMILIYTNTSNKYFKSYHLGHKVTIIEKVFKNYYGENLLSYLATGFTILEMRKKNIDGIIFTSLDAAKWLYQGSCDSYKLFGNKRLTQFVDLLVTELKTDYLPQLAMWRPNYWGQVSPLINGNRFEVKPDQILTIEQYLKNQIKPKKKKNDRGKGFEAFDWL